MTAPPPQRRGRHDPGSSRARSLLAALRTAPKVPTVLVGLTVLLAVLAPLVAPHSPVAPNLSVREMPPVFMDGGSWSFPLGTDRQGRDVLTRIIVGTRSSLSVAVLSILFSGLVGTTLGIVAGYRGGWADALLMRSVDVMLAFPAILIALVFAITVGPSFWIVVAVLSLLLWARYARLVRSEVLALKQRDFVLLAQVSGCSPLRIVGVHLLPNIVNSIVVLSTLQVGWAVVVEASLSFLGAGVPPPTPTWGNMIASGRSHLPELWWLSVAPGVAIMLVVLSFNMFGDWLRDVLDPNLRQL